VTVENDYSRSYPDYSRTPKAVIAAIAYSMALRLCQEDERDAAEMLRQEWALLHENGVLRQEPC
jgi:hypothetical protein